MKGGERGVLFDFRAVKAIDKSFVFALVMRALRVSRTVRGGTRRPTDRLGIVMANFAREMKSREL